MHLSPVQFICALLIASFVFLCLYARVRLPLAKHPATPGVTYRVLHAYQYLQPIVRVCPGCGRRNSPTFVKCAAPPDVIDHSKLPDDLTQPKEFFTTEHVRQWGLRTLIGIILLAALSLGQPPAIYAAIGAVVVWLVIPMVACQRNGGITFVIVAVACFAATAIVRFALSADRHVQLKAINPSILSSARLPLVNISLSGGTVTLGMVWLNGLCALAALIAIGLSVIGHTQNKDDDFYGPLTVLYLGVALAGLLLVCISFLQQLNGVAHLYLFLAVVATGWLLGAFLTRSVAAALHKMKPATGNWHPLKSVPLPKRPKTPPPPPKHSMSEQVAYIVTRIVISTSYTGWLAGMQTLNMIIRVLNEVANTLYKAGRWVVRYVQAVFLTLIKDILLSLPVLFRLASAGFRVAMFAPALLIGASVLLAISANDAHAYLLAGGPLHMLSSVVFLAGASLAATVAAALYVHWSVVRSFLFMVREEYIPEGIIFFAVFLDLYGLERVISHQKSHFGLISWLLNGVFIVVMVEGFRRQRAHP